MGGRIEVQRVHEVVEIYNGVSRCLVGVLRPSGSADEHHGLGVVPPDDFQDLLGIGLHLAPAHIAVGLVANLIDHVGPIGVGGRYLVPERQGLLAIEVGVAVLQHVPVDDGVHVGLGGVVHALRYEVLERRLVAVGAIAAVLVGVEGQTCKVCAPTREFGEAVLVNVLGKPRQAVRAEALELDRLALGIHEPGALNPEFAMG